MATDDEEEPRPRPRTDTVPRYTGAERRHANGNGWTSLRGWAQAIGIVGIPGAIAIFLVYIGAATIPTLVRQLEVVLTEIRQNGQLIRESNAHGERLLRLAQKSCVNAAKDDQARQNCFDQ